jgi:hypothetical protein
MKKLILGAVMLIAFNHFSNAQQVAPVKPAVAKAKVVKEVAATQQVKQPVAKPVVKAKEVADVKTTNAQGVVLKKDGTPDNRYKKPVSTTTGPLKKDGTADLRFKANKKPKS